MGPSAPRIASRYLAHFTSYPVRDTDREEDEDLNSWREDPQIAEDTRSHLPGQDDENEPYQNEEKMQTR